jgi:hypothetical protein
MSLTYAQLIDGSVVSISFGAGTQSAPSLYYSVDTTTGIFFPGTGTFALTTSGTERLRIDSSGRLLVGTSTARSNAFGASTIQLEDAGGLFSVTQNANNAFGGAFVLAKTRGTSFQTVTNGDNLGILSWQGANGSALIEGARIQADVDGAVSGGGAADLPTRLVFSTTADGSASPTERMRIDSVGRVGIGITGPNTLLDVNGAITARGDGNQVGLYLGSGAAIRDSGTASITYLDLATGSASHGQFVVRSSNAYTERLRIDSSGNVGIGLAGSAATAYLHLAAGGTAASTAPIKLTSGSLLTTAEVGATEYDGSSLYFTTNTTSTGRGQVAARQIFRLAANGSALGPTIADYFGATSSINLPATGVYEIEYFLYFTKTTAGTVTFTLTASSAPTGIFGTYIGAPATGVGSGAPQSGYTGAQAAATAAFPATASLTTAVNHTYTIRAQIITNAATTFKVQVTSSAGTVTPLAGSFYAVRRVAASTGNFA